MTRELAADSGAPEGGSVLTGEGARVVASFNARSKVKEGDNVESVVDTRNLHFFDPDTGLGIYGSDTNGAGGTT
jgi:multiple sugar transport system ATP-binding protein